MRMTNRRARDIIDDACQKAGLARVKPEVSYLHYAWWIWRQRFDGDSPPFIDRASACSFIRGFAFSVEKTGSLGF